MVYHGIVRCWTFGLTPGAVQHARTGEPRQASVDRLIAFTDGFEGLVPRYDVGVVHAEFGQ